LRRKYLNKVEVWLNGVVSDNFGGNILSPSQLGSSWCNISTINRDKLVAYGLDIAQEAITIKTRYRSDIDYFQNGLFFIYEGREWHPNTITEKDINKEEIIIIASGRATETVTVTATETFDNTFDNTFL